MSTPKTMEPPEPPVWYNQNEAAAWLAGWSDCASTGPAEGEVGELAVFLRDCAEDHYGQGRRQFTRAADLLEQRQAAPVPVPVGPSDDELDAVVIAIQALTPHQPDATTQDLAAVDQGREILLHCLARWGRPAPAAEGEVER